MNFRVQLDQAPTMMKTRQDNDMTKHASAVYVICFIKLSMVCDKTRYNNDMTDHIGLVYAKI